MDHLLSKGKNILQLTSICSKYENEKEIVQPFKTQNLNDKPTEILTSNDQTLKDFKEVGWNFLPMQENVSFSIIFFIIPAQSECSFKDGKLLGSL